MYNTPIAVSSAIVDSRQKRVLTALGKLFGGGLGAATAFPVPEAAFVG